MRGLIGAAAVLALAGAAAGQGKKDDGVDAKKLVGRWESADPAKAVTLEFAEKDKLTVSVTVAGRTDRLDGSYKLDGNKLDLALRVGGEEKKDTVTLSRLTDDELVGRGLTGGEETFKRVRPKK